MDNKARRLVIIAGMHRSGTSLLANILHTLGFSLGDNLIPAPEYDNALGYWEPQEVVDLHEALFKAMHLRSDDCDIFPAGWQGSAPAQQAKNTITQWLGTFSDQNRFIAVKDPRICRFLPLWTEVAKEQGFDVSFVLPIRNPLEVALSLAKRGDEYRDTQRSLLWWLAHVLEAERNSRGHKRVVYIYPELIENWQDVAERIARNLEFSWPEEYTYVGEKIENIVSPTLYRNQQSSDALNAIDQLGWAAQVFDMFSLHSAGKDELNLGQLDKIYEQLVDFLEPLKGGKFTPHGSDEEIKQLEKAIMVQNAPWWKRLF